MRYQDCAEPAQAPDETDGEARLADANINPRTGLATDYLNHFNEAVMLLEMLGDCPDCIGDFLAWQPLSYREHFAASRFKGRDLAIAAYETSDPALRQSLDALAGTMTAVLLAARGAMRAEMPPQGAAGVASRAVACLKPLIAQAGAIINGETEGAASPQAAVDGLMRKRGS
ncbi:MAG TPA: hypothetical protein VFB31_00115 [Pseudolabrys sp.]|nr:hypothetical protein [Pseudolabrys sp.]